MPLLTLSAYAKHAGISPSMVTKCLKQGVFEGALVYKDGRKKPLIDSAKADKLRADRQGVQPKPKPKKSKPKTAKKTPKKRPKTSENDEKEDQKRQTIADAGFDENATYSDAQKLDKLYSAANRKLKFEKDSGKVVDAEKVEKDGYDLGAMVKNKLTGIPSRLSALVAPETDPFKCEQILKVEINAILEEFSQESMGL